MRIISKKIVNVDSTPVYDVSVPFFENFVLANGAVVHNSKDCIAGYTLIPLVSGLKMPIAELVGRSFMVYSALPNGKVVTARAKNVHLVGMRDVLTIKCYTGNAITCTDDHEIMLKDGTFIEAKNLKVGARLMSKLTPLAVESITYLKDKIDVYDMTVEGTHNFEISSGIFVHNCISGDTLIPLLKGDTTPIKDLIGKDFWVYSSLPNGSIVPARARNVHKVGTLPVLKITLDSGDTLTCTPDHEIMLRDGSFIEAKDLKEGNSLMPFYTKVSEGDSRYNLHGYHQVINNLTSKFEFTHRVVMKYVTGFNYGGTKFSKDVIHHIDFNKLNNCPSNLVVMDWVDHLKLHQTFGTTNLKQLWKDPAFRARTVLRASKLGKLTGVKNITKYNKSPERIVKLKASGLFRSNGIKAGAIMKEKWNNPEYRKIQIRKMKLTNGYTRRDIVLEKIIETAKISGSLTEILEKLNCTQKVVMRVLDEHNVPSLDIKKLCDPELKKARYQVRTDLTFDFLKNEASNYGGLNALCKGLGITPKVVYARLSKEELNELATCFDKSKRNQSIHYRSDVTFELMVDAACNKTKTLFEICTDLKIHSSVAERIIASQGLTKEQFKNQYCHLRFNNHKVVSIEYLDDPIDVYDMTVDETHNFAIASGIFISNCSDAFAGTISGLISRREIWGNFGISPTDIPDTVRKIVKDSKDEEKIK